jgi:hypothetical protein
MEDQADMTRTLPRTTAGVAASAASALAMTAGLPRHVLGGARRAHLPVRSSMALRIRPSA